MRQVKGAQVICATCIGAGADILSKLRLPCVLVDEATQATEAATLVPLCRGAEQLVMLGDQCQLPPTVVSRHPTALAASSPLFNRLISDGAAPLLLDCQYRMHPAIAMLPCDLVYGGQLQTGVDGADRPAPPGFDWPRRDWPVALVPVLHGQESTEGVSKLNRTEAEATARVVDGLLRAGVKPSEIGVISPYGAQVRVLRSLLRSGARDPNSVEVSSVDGFQGREKDVIVFSCVRANAGGALGFLADARRLNVAFTRARCGLIVLGNPSTLGREEGTAWWHWLRWARAHGLVCGERPWGEYDARATRGASNAVMASFGGGVANNAAAAPPAGGAVSAADALWSQASRCADDLFATMGGGNGAAPSEAAPGGRGRGRSRSRSDSRGRRRRSDSRDSRSRSRSDSRSRSRSRSRVRRRRSSSASRSRSRGDSEESGEDDEGAAANGGAAAAALPLPAGWQAVESADGTYYWHTATNSVTWERPLE